MLIEKKGGKMRMVPTTLNWEEEEEHKREETAYQHRENKKMKERKKGKQKSIHFDGRR